ncbi:DUF4189 domain-containing protein [Luteibacter sp.]|uniref:DUF4189 domain-containing protein n=1 Tax=Luteibacter sp. TaxID=1886636 RepID=UPI0039C965B5
MKRILSAILLCALAQSAFSQCAPGIPSAGNPGCIPPNQQNSPYYQGSPSGADGVPEAPAPQWAQGWGAISLDFSQGGRGSAAQMESKESAERAAVRDCQKNGGAKCEVFMTFVNQCAAVAQPLSGGDLSTATAATVGEAESRSIRRCGDAKSCKVFISECSAPVRIN